jgi:hypothetical protein
MNVGAVNGAMSGLAAAQSIFGVAAQAAASVGAAGGDGASGSAGNVAEQAGVAVLRMALDQERSLVNILA